MQAGTATIRVPASNQEHKVLLLTHVDRWHALQHCKAEKAMLQHTTAAEQQWSGQYT